MRSRYKAVLKALAACLVVFCVVLVSRSDFSFDLGAEDVTGLCFNGSRLSQEYLMEITKYYDFIPAAKKQPQSIELLNLMELNMRNQVHSVCQIGFDPFLAMSQLRVNPASRVYIFHSFEDDTDRDVILPRMEERFKGQFISIVGNPMQTVREFARQFGRAQHSFDKDSYQFLKNATGLERDLHVDEDRGFACDIVHVNALGNRTYNALLLSALLAHEDTQLVFRGEPALWDRALQHNVVREMCSEHAGLSYGQFVRPYATSQVSEERPVYDAKDLIADYLHALEQALVTATKGKTNTVIWVPVASGHKQFADSLYCSLRALGIDNYIYFSLDDEIHSHFIANGRNAFKSGEWYSQLSGGKHKYHSFNYNTAMRERFTILLDMFDLGYDVLLNDADIVWVSDALKSLESRESSADMIAQLDTAGDGEWGELCGGFVLHRARPNVKKFFSMVQQLAFLLPDQEDQQLTNTLLLSHLACQRLVGYPQYQFPGILQDDEPCPSNEHLIEVELLNPLEYVSGHMYCKFHDAWAKENTVPTMIHLNGADSKEECAAKSKLWGYDVFHDSCK